MQNIKSKFRKREKNDQTQMNSSKTLKAFKNANNTVSFTKKKAPYYSAQASRKCHVTLTVCLVSVPRACRHGPRGVVDVRSRAPLHIAVASEAPASLNALLYFAADVAQADEDGDLPSSERMRHFAFCMAVSPCFSL